MVQVIITVHKMFYRWIFFFAVYRIRLALNVGKHHIPEAAC